MHLYTEREKDTDNCLVILNLGWDRTHGTNLPCIQYWNYSTELNPHSAKEREGGKRIIAEKDIQIYIERNWLGNTIEVRDIHTVRERDLEIEISKGINNLTAVQGERLFIQGRIDRDRKGKRKDICKY